MCKCKVQRVVLLFFFQAEDGIRDIGVTGVQTCALPILSIDGQVAVDSDIVRWRIGRRVSFALRHPDYVDHVLHEGADRYHKSIEYELLRTVLGLNLFTDEDESWRRHRMLLNPVMSKRHVKGMGDLMIAPIAAFLEDTDDGRDHVEIEM